MTAAPARTVARPGFRDAARALGRVCLVGAVCGVLVGGIGGRLAMMALRFTSGDAVVGVTSDDGFRIGRFSGETLFLLGVTAFLGIAGALVYTAGRGWVPRRWRAATFGTLAGLVVGADIVKTEGIDFTLLTPPVLAIALFVAIPAVYGVGVSLWIERVLAPGRPPLGAAWLGYLPLLVFALLGPAGLAVLVVLLAGCAIWVQIPALAEIWRSAIATWLGRTAIGIATLTSLVELAGDTRALLA